MEIPGNSRVARFVQWYKEHPAYLERMQENAEPYLFHIVEELEKHNMPLELALLPAVESNYTPTAESRSGAVGMWQFIHSTGKNYGLDQNPWYDERRHPMASTEAALNYLIALHDMFGGDWELAIAAYNAGEGTVGRARTANEQKDLPTDYWSLDLPTETEEYLPRLLALASLIKRPRQHGVDLAYIPNRPQLVEVETVRTLDLATAAERSGLDKKEFGKLNAAYLTSVTTSQPKHRILVPAHKADELVAVLDQLPEVSAPPPPLRYADVVAKTYTVKRGDTLSAIARRFNVSVDRLQAANHMNGSVIKVGQDLTIKGGRPTSSTRTASAEAVRVYKVKSGDTLSAIARRFNVSPGQLQTANKLDDSVIKVGQNLTIEGGRSTSSKPTVSARAARVYLVKSGDTLWSIARSHKVNLERVMPPQRLIQEDRAETGSGPEDPATSQGRRRTPHGKLLTAVYPA